MEDAVRRSNQLVLAGVAFFVVGVVIVLLLARDDGSPSSAGGADSTPVLVAKETISSGTKGADAITMVEVRQVKLTEKQPTALTSPSQLSNARISAAFAKGEQILSTGVTAALASVEAPAGFEAVPVKAPFVGAGAGYIAPGDYVNVYQVYPSAVQVVGSNGEGNLALPYSTPRVELLLTKIQVLDVNTQISSLAGQASTPTSQPVQSRPGEAGVSTQTIVVLALKTADVEKVVFGSQADGLLIYLTKVDKDSAPAGPTPGQDYETNLQQEANDALAAAGGN
ncbi:MAG: RcpC/CpaB family pilus assembly protein [Acidimicrobiales bacterium]